MDMRYGWGATTALLATGTLLTLGVFFYLVWSTCKRAMGIPILSRQGLLLYITLLSLIIILIAVFGHLAWSCWRAFKIGSVR
jgi:hypothetical protein